MGMPKLFPSLDLIMKKRCCHGYGLLCLSRNLTSNLRHMTVRYILFKWLQWRVCLCPVQIWLLELGQPDVLVFWGTIPVFVLAGNVPVFNWNKNRMERREVEQTGRRLQPGVRLGHGELFRPSRGKVRSMHKSVCALLYFRAAHLRPCTHRQVCVTMVITTVCVCNFETLLGSGCPHKITNIVELLYWNMVNIIKEEEIKP